MHLLPQLKFFFFFFFFFKFKKISQKNNKDILYGKETISSPSMCGKIKPILKEKGSELSREKSSRPMCFFCHPHKVPAEIFSTQQEKIWG
jgi:hypothetical protein